MQLVSELYAAGLARVMELAERHAPELVGRITADELLASLLIANGLHPDDVHVRIAKALDGVRPFLAGHGGDVELLDIDEQVGAVRLRLLGSCDGCPSSAVTLRTTVERAIVDAAPEVMIIDVEEPSDHAVADSDLDGHQADRRLRPGDRLRRGARFPREHAVSTTQPLSAVLKTDPRHAAAAQAAAGRALRTVHRADP